MQEITQVAIETAKPAIMAVKEVENPGNATSSVQVMPKTGSSTLKQSTFNWKAKEKYQEQKIFGIEVKKIFITNSYNMQNNEKVLIILKCLGRAGLQFM